MKISEVEAALGHKFKNKDLLTEALTHRSYLNENTAWKLPHNERMEFLGDAVLELIVTEALYNRYPEKAEGELTSLRAALVNYQTLGRVARNFKIEENLLLSRGEAKDTGRAREVILANAFESLVGAIYLDGGYGAAKIFVDKALMTELDAIFRQGLYRDAKSVLQEKIQKDSKVTPHYQVLRESGPDHAKTFNVGVYAGERFLAEGAGSSKHEAELKAAEAALERFKD